MATKRLRVSKLSNYQLAVQNDALIALLATARNFVTAYVVGSGGKAVRELSAEQKALCADLAFSLAQSAPKGVEW